MIIERRPALPGKIVVAFEQSDMDLGGGTIWPDAKEAIKERFPYPESKWDPELKVWLIEDTKNNLEGIRAIKRRYFENENQEELF